jgi:hypothetical protein
MWETFEISDRYIEPGDANGLLYEPIEGGVTFRATRRYEVEFDGELHEGESPALEDFSFALEYGMKPGALDLEKEAILGYYKGIEDPGFELKDLTIRQRIYLFGGGDKESDRFVRDICNAAIHNWNEIQGNV